MFLIAILLRKVEQERAFSSRSACANLSCQFGDGWKVGELHLVQCFYCRCLRSLAVVLQRCARVFVLRRLAW